MAAERVTGAELFECSTCNHLDLSNILDAFRPTTILHLAANGVTARGSDVESLLRGNVDFTVNLIRAASDHGSPAIVHTGSCFEYAPCDPSRNLIESDLIQPFSLYGATKAASVQLALGLSKHLNVPLVVMRLFGVFGPGESDERLVPSLVRHLTSYQPMDLTPGLQVRDWMYIDDVAHALGEAAMHVERLEPHSIYNICTGVGRTVREVGEMLASELDRPPSLLRWGARPAREGEPPRIVGDSSRFQAATNWRPRYTLRSGLRTTATLLQQRSSMAA